MIDIILADDHELFIEGLNNILSQEENLRVVGLARTGQAALDLALKHHPGIVIMDVTMPVMNGIEATRRILASMPDIKILALSMHADKRLIAEILKAGASGYALKEGSSSEFIDAIGIVMGGELYLSPKVSSILVKDYIKLLDNVLPSQAGRLSNREKEVLTLLVRGDSSKHIASLLHISKNTVDTHRRKIMDKLDCSNIAELTRYSIREGLIDLG